MTAQTSLPLGVGSYALCMYQFFLHVMKVYTEMNVSLPQRQRHVSLGTIARW